MELRINTKKVSLDEMRPNPWNPKATPEEDLDVAQQLEETVKSIKNYGLVEPLLVRSGDGTKDLGYYEIINGYHRYLACLELGWKEVIVNDLGSIDDQQAKKLTIVTEEIKIPIDQSKLSILLKEMINSEDLDKLAEGLPYSKELIQSKIELLDFDWDDLNAQHINATQDLVDEELDREDNIINLVFETHQDKMLAEEFLKNQMTIFQTTNFANAFLGLIKTYDNKNNKAGDEPAK